MADVSELRIELIFPRSTFARLTPSGLAGVLWALAEVGVTVVAVAAATSLFEAFVGVVGATAVTAVGIVLSFLFPACKS